MTIAVIVPVLNEQRVLPRLLTQAANLPIDELIVVDGGSSDATCELLHAAKVRWIRSAPGRAQQMNAGARLATSDILLFLHADTAIDASAIEAMRQAMRSDPDVVGGRFDLRLSGSHPALRVIECMINLRSRLTRISTGDQAMFVRRAVFARLGGFPTLPLMEDVAFSRMLKRTGRIACLKARVCTSSRRWEQHGLGRTVLLMWWLRLLFWLGVPPARLARMYRHAR